MLLAMVIISGFFMLCSFMACGALVKEEQYTTTDNGLKILGKIIQAIAWAFFFVVNLISLVK
jgi:hypothetical protein